MPKQKVTPDIKDIVPKAKMRRQLHQSGLEQLSKCGEQFRFRYIEGIKRPPKSYFISGTALDTAVGADLNNKIETGELHQLDFLTDLARDTVEHYPDKESLEPEEDEKGKPLAEILGAVKDKSVRFVIAHHANHAPKIQPSQIARKFSINLDDFLRMKAKEMREREYGSKWAEKVADTQARYLNVAARDGLDFVGEMDIVEKIPAASMFEQDQLVIRDSKTAKKTPSADTAHESHQLTSYAVAAHVLEGKLPDAVKLDYIVDLQRETKTITLESHREMSDVNIFLERVVSAVATIESGNFVGAPDTAWWCSKSQCGYWDICRYTRKQTLVQIKTEVKK